MLLEKLVTGTGWARLVSVGFSSSLPEHDSQVCSVCTSLGPPVTGGKYLAGSEQCWDAVGHRQREARGIFQKLLLFTLNERLQPCSI